MTTITTPIETEKRSAERSRSKFVPALRFDEFEGVWSNYILKDLVSQFIVPMRDKPKKLDGPIPWCRIEDFDGKYLSYSKTGQGVTSDIVSEMNLKVYPVGTLLVSCSANLGFCAITRKELITNQTFIGLFPNVKKTSIEFLFYIMKMSSRRLNILSSGTTISYLSRKGFEQFNVKFPLLPEQQKIASFLSAVDEKIQQLTKKKALLEQYKKGVMQQLFSAQLRFKDENGNSYPDWEEKRLDAMISKFVVPMRDKPKELKGEIPWCRIEDFDGKYLSSSKSGQGVSVEIVEKMNLKVFPAGTLLVSCSANLGFCAITQVELITNQTFIGLVPDNNKVDVLYLLYVMRMMARQLNVLSSGTTISYLSRQQFEKFKVSYPNLSEQQKIAIYLSSIDTKIKNVTHQITQTQTFKKGLLQQMFV